MGAKGRGSLVGVASKTARRMGRDSPEFDKHPLRLFQPRKTPLTRKQKRGAARKQERYSSNVARQEYVETEGQSNFEEELKSRRKQAGQGGNGGGYGGNTQLG